MEEVEEASYHFRLMYSQLSKIEKDAPWAVQMLDQIQLLKLDVGFLITFCGCLETWDFDTDEESMERLRSIITPLKVIWPKEYVGFSLLSLLADYTNNEEIWSSFIQDFHTVLSEFEAKIQQSKQQVEGWCENFMHSSMQCKSLISTQLWNFLLHLHENLNDFSTYQGAEIVPLKKQIDILTAKILFMYVSVRDIELCPSTKEYLQFMDFTCLFSNKTACLACLYWTKEDKEEMETEMNIVLFDMLQKFFIPSAADITSLYIGILNSHDLQPSDSILLGVVVASFVDFFFEHLATVLKDDFLILRDRLIHIFIFLTNPPCQNAVKEEDLIRIQIYALFHEDAYLLLPFDKMKDDFSKKKMLLSDCMIKIDITIAKIRELCHGFSDSWIRLEVEKMEYIYFVSVQRELYWIEKHAKWANSVVGELQLYRMELRFLRAFLLCFATWDDSDEEIRVKLSSIITSLQGIWRNEELLPHRLYEIRTGDITDWHPLASELKEKIHLSKLEMEAWCVNSFYSSFRCKPSTSYNILKFIDSVLDNLKDLVGYKAGEIVPFMKQIETLEEKLVFLKDFIRLTANCIYSKELGEFRMFVQVFANDAACLTFLYWTKDATHKIASETNSMLSHMLRKIKPATSDIAGLYFGTFKAIYVQRSDSHMFGQTALSFVEFFLEDPVTDLNEDFKILQDDMVFLLTFLNNPPHEYQEEIICSQIDVLFWEDVCGILPFDDIGRDFSRKKELLSDFMMKLGTVNTSIRQIYSKFPDSSLYNFPKVVSPRCLEFLIQNLRNLKERMICDRKYAPFAKCKIIEIEEELVSLSPFFNHIFGFQSEVNVAWLEVVNLVHLTEHVINSCISSWFVFDHPIWYYMTYLSYVLDGIKVAKAKLKNIKENIMYNAICLPHSVGFVSTLSEQTRPSENNEIVVGFEDEAEKIISILTWGQMPLDIVSIVGMGGLGKTTLAKKVYGSPYVKCNFHVSAFCYVSQDDNTKKLLLDILCDINGVDDHIFDMTEDDLAHQLWKCLSRQKYLIVLDDIWNTSVWNKVKSSFPDDKNGSRVIITTRSREVADKCKISSSPHQLRFLSEVESWELLQNKVFHNNNSPPYLYELGKLIAKNCKGLPLAVSVIAGLLARTEKSERWWNEVAERVVSYLSNEGCMNILELSYKHLPENLKPCFLYLGALPENRLIKVKQVIMLWIAEGFIQESKTKIVEDVAKEYFRDLVDRSLIIVSKRSSNGEMKTFRVHDLIHDICQTKCREGNFFQMSREIAQSSFSGPSINKHYRVSTQKQNDVTVVVGSLNSNVRTLLYFGEKHDWGVGNWEFRLAQVLDLDLMFESYDTRQLGSLVHLRHMNVKLMNISTSIPSSISNLWNIGSLMLTLRGMLAKTRLPETFWTMKSLRHVEIKSCFFEFSDVHEHEECPKLDKVVSFSNPFLATGKDVQRLLQRLPVVRELRCYLENSPDYDEESVETLDFDRKLESLKVTHLGTRRQYMINFPSTLKILVLEDFELPWTVFSAIAEIHCLQVLKLRRISFPESKLEMEDLVFQNLKFFELNDKDLVEWNASAESLPCLEQLVIECPTLEELPPCFGEISTLTKIIVKESSQVASSALRIREELMDLGTKVEVSVFINGRLV